VRLSYQELAWGDITVSVEELKRAAGYRAVDYVTSGMVVGLGSGSTARYATLCIGERLRAGALRDIVAIPTSDATAQLAREAGIPLTTLEEHPRIDVTLDGADEVAPNLDVIKGLGGFLLREKIVAFATTREMIVVDESKLVTRLGTKSPLPVEVIRFGWRNTEAALVRTGACPRLRLAGGQPYVTDEGNYILDCAYTGIDAPHELAATLNTIPGVVENGLFLGLVQTVIVASSTGIRIWER
jgi:ribose 5-phosphate isomerase A